MDQFTKIECEVCDTVKVIEGAYFPRIQPEGKPTVLYCSNCGAPAKWFSKHREDQPE